MSGNGTYGAGGGGLNPPTLLVATLHSTVELDHQGRRQQSEP
jgi:hypothetical protein